MSDTEPTGADSSGSRRIGVERDGPQRAGVRRGDMRRRSARVSCARQCYAVIHGTGGEADRGDRLGEQLRNRRCCAAQWRG